MNQYVITILIVLAAAGASALITWAAVKLHSGGKDGEEVLEKVGAGLTYAQSVAEAVTPYLPAIAGAVINKVLDIAQKAVTHVEGTYKAAISTDPSAADTRKTEATSLIKSALALDGIPDTPEVDKLIDVVIPLLVLALPKTHTDAAVVKSGAQ
jgi:hypothetical protein